MSVSRELFRTSTLTVLDVSCPPGHEESGGREIEPAFAAVLPRSGVFRYHVESAQLVADPTIGFLLNKGEVHKTSHLTDDGDRNTVVKLDDDIAEGFLSSKDSFGRRIERVGLGGHIAHQLMLARIRHADASALEIDEWGLGMIHSLLRVDVPVQASRARRILVADTREFLGTAFASDLDLRGVAREVGSSPHHLSRIFRALVGITMSQYRTQLRLRHVIDRLSEGAEDLATLAITAGFFDHAHMTHTMKRQAGMTPSHLRNLLNGGDSGPDPRLRRQHA